MSRNFMKQGLFDCETMTVTFGGELSKPENRFVANAIKVPDYKYKKQERESLGNGWYGSMEVNEYTEDNEYLIFKENGEFMGAMSPYRGDMKHCKSQLYHPIKQALDFLKTLNVEYKN